MSGACADLVVAMVRGSLARPASLLGNGCRRCHGRPQGEEGIRGSSGCDTHQSCYTVVGSPVDSRPAQRRAGPSHRSRTEQSPAAGDEVERADAPGPKGSLPQRSRLSALADGGGEPATYPLLHGSNARRLQPPRDHDDSPHWWLSTPHESRFQALTEGEVKGLATTTGTARHHPVALY